MGIRLKKITYIITHPLGIHARSAGFLAKVIESFECRAIIKKGEKEVNAKKIIDLMSLGVKQGDKIAVTFDGEDEEMAVKVVEKFLKETL